MSTAPKKDESRRALRATMSYTRTMPIYTLPSGEHALSFAPHVPHWDKSPTEYDGFLGFHQKYFLLSQRTSDVILGSLVITSALNIALLGFALITFLNRTGANGADLATILSRLFLISVVIFCLNYPLAVLVRKNLIDPGKDTSIHIFKTKFFHATIFVHCAFISLFCFLTVIANNSSLLMLFPLALFVLVSFKHLEIALKK